MRDQARAISSSVWTVRLALLSLAILLLTILFHRLLGMSTLVALNLFRLSFAGALLVLLIGLFALVRIWQRGWRGGSNAVAGMVIALAILAWPASLLPTLQRYPAINDITTDLQNPPQFVHLGRVRPRGANPITYPGKAFGDLQRAAYGDLGPVRVERSATETLELARLALRKLHMTILAEVPVDTKGGGWGQIEAVDRTLVLGFYDDVAVRVTRISGGALVDVRSASRFGRSDFGRNAQRIREFHSELANQIRASVPGVRYAPRRQTKRK